MSDQPANTNNEGQTGVTSTPAKSPRGGATGTQSAPAGQELAVNTTAAPPAQPVNAGVNVTSYGGVQEDYVLVDNGEGDVRIYPKDLWEKGKAPATMFKIPGDQYDGLLKPTPVYGELLTGQMPEIVDAVQRALWGRGVLSGHEELTPEIAAAAAAVASSLIRDRLVAAYRENRQKLLRGGA